MSDERSGRARFDDLREAYALGALSESERQEVEDYLASHPELQAEVDELTSIADLLALAPQEYEPSPDIRGELLETIGGATDAALTVASSPRSPRPAGLRGLFGPGGLAAAAVAAAAALIVAGLFLWNTSLRDQNEDLRGEIETRQTYELQGSGAAENVSGEVVEIEDDRAILVAENLDAPPEDEVYEIWVLHGGVPAPAGLFEPGSGGFAATPIEGSLEGAEAVAVTLEPSGGSPAPTSDILLTASL